jgi:hypothetical protein
MSLLLFFKLLEIFSAGPGLLTSPSRPTMLRNTSSRLGRSMLPVGRASLAMSTEREIVLEEIAPPALSTVISPVTPADRRVQCQDIVVPTANHSVSRYMNPLVNPPISEERNPGMPFDPAWVMKQHINKSGVDQRAGEIGTRRSVKKQWQAAWLLKAITQIDLTTLAGDDTTSNVRRLCAKAANPVRADILEMLGASDLKIQCGAVCVYPR